MTGKFVMKDYDSLPPADEMLRATLSRIEDSLTFSNGKEGARFRFDLTDHVGWSATALCSGELDLHNQYGRVISGLLGRTPKPGEVLDDALAACVGQPYRITLQHNEVEDGRMFLNVENIEKL